MFRRPAPSSTPIPLISKLSLTPITSMSSRIGLLCNLLVLVLCIWIFSSPIRHAGILMAHAQDDFYYYLKVAQNIAAGHGSTFDGSTLTNGYHPLYMLLLVTVCHIGTQLSFIFKFLWFLDTLCAFATFLLLRGFFSRRQVNPWLANGLALVLLSVFMRLFFMQMEVTLTIPIGLGFLTLADRLPERYSKRRLLVLGALAALMVLSRLDSIFLVLLFSGALLFNAAYRAVLTPAKIAAFAGACGFPLAIYFAINERFFHRLMPISGAAKQLKLSWRPSSLALHSLRGFTGLFLAITICALLIFLLRAHSMAKIGPADRVIVSSCLLFPLVHFTTLVFLSDWQLWGWYSYSVGFSLFAAVLLLVQAFPSPSTRLRRLALPYCLLALAALAVTRYQIDPEMLAIYQTSLQLEQFERTHPGTYAMGDRAGMFSYLSQSPVLQTEG